ncbi:putative Cysteine-rich RLK (RECEPTOR-like protein kinase) 8 [Hibiscus syriacus]|uniref:Cysteine-rich RLK (RECEPTOR-like protein kinase) 8 n=1 Tax=Hibiscus syriacus TaxID=106335 RepID=A0A6A3D019_HIBSY|nr:putative Cysteine-rich RLK (RECEPTOR-like protein kinase) 8 [Hibiscus syriacus]
MDPTIFSTRCSSYPHADKSRKLSNSSTIHHLCFTLYKHMPLSSMNAPAMGIFNKVFICILAHFPNSTSDLFVTNHLITVYSKCGYLQYAQQLFDEMPERNIVSWTALVSGYAQCGRSAESFRLFLEMLADRRSRPNEFEFTSVLSSCDDLRGKQLHALLLKMGLDASVYISNALITMYSKNKVEEAWTLFRSLGYWTQVSWNSMIAGFQLAKLGMHAIGVFVRMHHEGIGFNRATLLSVFSSLCGRKDIEMDLGLKFCFQVYCLSVKTGFISEVEVATAFMKAYSELGGDISEFFISSWRQVVKI